MPMIWFNVLVPFSYRIVYIAAEQVGVEGVVHLSTEDCKTDLLEFSIGQFGAGLDNPRSLKPK